MKWNRFSKDNLPEVRKWILLANHDVAAVGVYDGKYIQSSGTLGYGFDLPRQHEIYRIPISVMVNSYWTYISTIEEIEKEIRLSGEEYCVQTLRGGAEDTAGYYVLDSTCHHQPIFLAYLQTVPKCCPWCGKKTETTI